MDNIPCPALVPGGLHGEESKALFVVCWSLLDPDVQRCMFAILTKWFSSTRLETRTKESNMYASIWV